MKLLLELMRLSNVRDLVGRRDLLFHDGHLNPETQRILDLAFVLCILLQPRSVAFYPSRKTRSHLNCPRISGPLLESICCARWRALRENLRRKQKFRAWARLLRRLWRNRRSSLDYLVSDGAQVTRPSIDPYREEIEIFSYLPGPQKTTFRLSAPFFFTHLPDSIPLGVRRVFARTSIALGLLFDVDRRDIGEYSPFAERLIFSTGSQGNELVARAQLIENAASTDLLRIPSSQKAMDEIVSTLLSEGQKTKGIILDEDASKI